VGCWLYGFCLFSLSQLIGRINKVGVISPRYDVKVSEYENWVNNVLPSRQVSSAFGIDKMVKDREKAGGLVVLYDERPRF